MASGNSDRILKDVNGNINNHLHNHIHLTNCIHLKNHIHKNSPMLADRAILRGLAVLQRSRSLRDPSSSPSSWHSPSATDLLLKRGERDVLVSGRRSVGLEHCKECRRRSEASLHVTDPPISKAAMGELRRRGKETDVGDHNDKAEFHARRIVRREESTRIVLGNDLADHINKSVKKKGAYRQDIPAESDDVALSCNHVRRHARMEKIGEEERANICSHGNTMKREKRHRFRSSRRNRPSIPKGAAETPHELSVTSNSFTRDPLKHRREENVQEYDDQNIADVSWNMGGIPWNWSRIHHIGKPFLDIASRSHSCRLSEPNLKEKGISEMTVMPEHSSSSTMSDGEALLLSLDASISQGSTDRAPRIHHYSGVLGIFADNLLKQELDFDLASEGTSCAKRSLRRQHTDRHQNLTLKYMPRNFGDLVGQNLVAQALSNAILKRKVGLLYVFYGPHGTGKTTCARIFGKALNCQSFESTKPCGVCDSCIAHDMGKSPDVRETCPVSKIDLESVIELIDYMIASHRPSRYGVLIFDECDTLSSDCWRAILKAIDRAHKYVVFILVCSSLDVLPRVIISRCQKFFFNKLKDADIIYTLQWIAAKEDLEIDKDALKLIASRSNGSLRDAEMTLEQLSLLGEKISLCLVQELVGLISDEKLADLLDSALSADTTITVKNLRELMESGVEPLTLMSQLATFITDILAGSYDSMRERHKRKFFEQQALSKEDIEKLRQALRTLSEAEKQLRGSSDKMTWLMAALLQLAPDQHYAPPRSSSLDHGPTVLNNSVLRVRHRKSNAEMHTCKDGSSGDVHFDGRSKGIGLISMTENGGRVVTEQVGSAENYATPMNKVKLPGKFDRGIEEIWLEVLEKISTDSLKEFMYQEGRLVSLSYGTAPTVQLLFNAPLTKSEVENFRSYILHAFESVLGSPVTIEIRSGNDTEVQPILLQGGRVISHSDVDIGRLQIRAARSGVVNTSEIVEVEYSPSESKCKRQGTFSTNASASYSDQRELSERSQSLSLVRGKVSLAHVIRHADGHSGWSMRKAISVAENLDQYHMRLESRSRRLLCRNPPRIMRRKISGLRIRTRKTESIMKYVSCGRCLSGRSSR